jgi:hypothetical protein
MMGSEIRPIEITEAATTPVVAASSAPTKITASARPPRNGPNTWPTVSSKSSAMPLRSRISPIKVKKGTASSVSLAMMPIRRSGSQPMMAGGKDAQFDADEAEEQAAGTQAEGHRKAQQQEKISPTNMTGAKLAAMNSMARGRLQSTLAVRGGCACGGLGLEPQRFEQFLLGCLVAQIFPIGSGPWPRR